MPIRTLQGNTDAVLHSLTLTTPSESGHLIAVTAFANITQRGTAELYGEIYLASIQTPTPQPQILITSGYFGAMGMFSWIGRLPLEPSTVIMGRFKSITVTTITLSILTEA